MKVVINAKFGSFRLSHAGIMHYARLKGLSAPFDWTSRDIDRDDPALVQTVRELGAAANGPHASLKIVEIPDDVEYTIEEYDGNEHIAERHRTWD